ncbi:hypothetical protein EGR_01830 [Echinococcus granulosus]|uniref:Uncharacterized protein n=1 Tax=Echinococcus granulosus TaxID=6210 RepID=W6V9L3_ECHGR|nr:hypothetical protein EGR_01830 [Echinococcus granulosus]EUB63339.1 hypothetical protein EGR_01830 [Echinococcus granulosus]
MAKALLGRGSLHLDIVKTSHVRQPVRYRGRYETIEQEALNGIRRCLLQMDSIQGQFLNPSNEVLVIVAAIS